MISRQMYIWSVLNALILGYAINDLIHDKKPGIAFAIAMVSIAIQSYRMMKK
jgi:hypothetical protein